MKLVMTRVKLKPNSHKAYSERFVDANPDLMVREIDWLDTQLVYHPDSNVVTVLASWRNAKSYEFMTGTLRYQHAMRRFSELWAAPPEITISDVLAGLASKPDG